MRIFSALVLLGLLLSGCKRKQSAALAGAQTVRESTSGIPLNAALRPVYPYSVVPGGIQSRGELLAAIQSDPVVAHHYSGVEAGALKPVRLDRAALAYVSFRVDDRVYWTSRKVKLAAGETIFQTKGVGVRGRCGNQVSDEPRSPVLANPAQEPSEEVLDTPTVWETAERQVLPEDVSAEVPVSPAASQSLTPAPGSPIDPPTIVPAWNRGNWTGRGVGSAANAGAGGSGESLFQPPLQPSIPTQPTIGPVIPPREILPTPLAPISSAAGLIPGTLPAGTSFAGGISLLTLAYGPLPYQPGGTPILIPIPTIQLPTGSAPNDPLPPPTAPPTPALPPDPLPLPPVTTHVSFTNQPPEQTIPEPATWVLAVCGLSLVLVSRVAR